jgi:hypothetical protein
MKEDTEESETRLGTIAIVISIVAAIVSGLQWYEARLTRTEVHDDAIATLKLSQRPYIGVDVQIVTKRASQQFEYPPDEIVTLESVGQSPSLDVRLALGCVMWGFDPEGRPRLDYPPKAIETQATFEHVTIVPSQKVVSECHDSTENIDLPGNVKYVVGWIEYKDIFGQGHETHFCFWQTVASSRPKDSLMTPCLKGNDSN